MNSSFWKSKRVLITGADGFIGSHLTERLLDFGAKVSILVKGNPVDGSSCYTLSYLPKETAARIDNIVCCDISSADTQEIIVKSRPRIIFHLAASAYVPYSFAHPFEVFAVNTTGTLHVLEAARRIKGIERVVSTSSSEVFGTAQAKKISESHPLRPTSPYAASKAAAEQYCISYLITYGLPIAVIRPFNTYGPRHTYDVPPKFIRLALHNKPLTIYGSGKQTRDFMYVSDTVDAFLTMGSHKKAVGRIVNFGTGKDVSVNTLASLIKGISKSKSDIVHVEQRLAEVDRLCCDYSLAKSLFGWEPKVSLEEGLRLNIEWAKKNRV
ncbi:MAG: GDP-mannose 4,6-dehydratase [Candidatus Omnitrophota bacterium]